MASEEEELLEGSSLVFQWPEEFGEQVVFLISFPLLFCMKYTVPDVKYAGVKPMLNGYIFLFTFAGSIIEVGNMSFFFGFSSQKLTSSYF